MMNDLVRLPHAFEEKRNWKKAAAPAGAALLLVALGWGAGAKIDTLRGPTPEQVAVAAAQDSADKALRAEQAQKQEIATLRVHVDGLKSKLEAQAQKTHESEAAVTALQKTLAEEKAQAQSATQNLQAKIDKIQAQAKVQAQVLAQPQPQQPDSKAHMLPAPPARPVDHSPTATIANPPASTDAEAKPGAATPPVVVAKLQAPTQKPYRAYVLRDVNDGTAVVEGREGIEEVGPGDTLSGGARVQRIERRGRGWVVVTDRGFIAPDNGGAWLDRPPSF
jgi:hypothetical protein